MSIQTEQIDVTGQQFYPEAFPLVIGHKSGAQSMTDVTNWIHATSEDHLAALAMHGAILFRGFPVKDANDFDAFIRAFGLDSFTYVESLSNAHGVGE